MRMPQVHCADYLSTDTIDLLRRRSTCRPRRQLTPLRCLITSVPTSRSSASVIRLPRLAGSVCYPGFRRSACTASASPLDLPPALGWPPAQSGGPFLTGIEIHPGRIGHSVFIDHGMGVVIGQTPKSTTSALPRRDSRWTGKDHGKRHPTLAENVVVGAGAKVLGAINIGANTRIGAGSVVVRDVDANCTVVGIPGRVIHQSGVRINPLAHSALPDAEANVIRNLMERIDALENQIGTLQACLKAMAAGRPIHDLQSGESQNLKDREILEFLGEGETTQGAR